MNEDVAALNAILNCEITTALAVATTLGMNESQLCEILTGARLPTFHEAEELRTVTCRYSQAIRTANIEMMKARILKMR